MLPIYRPCRLVWAALPTACWAPGLLSMAGPLTIGLHSSTLPDNTSSLLRVVMTLLMKMRATARFIVILDVLFLAGGVLTLPALF